MDRFDLDLSRAAMYGFIGPSGAGKTACIRMIFKVGLLLHGKPPNLTTLVRGARPA